MEFYIFAATALASAGRSQLEVFSSIWCLYLLVSCSSVGATAVQCTSCVQVSYLCQSQYGFFGTFSFFKAVFGVFVSPTVIFLVVQLCSSTQAVNKFHIFVKLILGILNSKSCIWCLYLTDLLLSYRHHSTFGLRTV